MGAPTTPAALFERDASAPGEISRQPRARCAPCCGDCGTLATIRATPGKASQDWNQRSQACRVSLANRGTAHFPVCPGTENALPRVHQTVTEIVGRSERVRLEDPRYLDPMIHRKIPAFAGMTEA